MTAAILTALEHNAELATKLNYKSIPEPSGEKSEPEGQSLLPARGSARFIQIIWHGAHSIHLPGGDLAFPPSSKAAGVLNGMQQVKEVEATWLFHPRPCSFLADLWFGMHTPV